MPLLSSHILLQSYSLTLVITSYILLTTPNTIINASSLWIIGEAMHMPTADFTTTPSSPFHRAPRGGPPSGPPPGQHPALPASTRELLALVSFIILLVGISQSILCSPLRYSTADLTHLAHRSISHTTTLSSSSSSVPVPAYAKSAEDSRSAFAEKLFNLHSTQTLFLTLSAVRVLLQGGLIAYIYLSFSTRVNPAASTTLGTNTAMSLLANRVVFTVAMADMLFWGYIWTVLRDEAREVAGLVGKRRKMEEEAEMTR